MTTDDLDQFVKGYRTGWNQALLCMAENVRLSKERLASGDYNDEL